MTVTLDAVRAKFVTQIERRSALVIDLDSDGILSALTLAGYLREAFPDRKPPEIVGGYDTNSLWLRPEWNDIDRLRDESLWLDAEIRVPGFAVVSNHIITNSAIPAIAQVPQDLVLFNPNYDLVGPLTAAMSNGGHRYDNKYPFSSVGYIRYLLDMQPPASRTLGWALFMMQDSAILNSANYWENTYRWATKWMLGGPYSHVYELLASHDGFRNQYSASKRRELLKTWLMAEGKPFQKAQRIVSNQLAGVGQWTPAGHWTLGGLASVDPIQRAVLAFHEAVNGESAPMPLTIDASKWRKVFREEHQNRLFDLARREPHCGWGGAFSHARVNNRSIRLTCCWPDGWAK